MTRLWVIIGCCTFGILLEHSAAFSVKETHAENNSSSISSDPLLTAPAAAGMAFELDSTQWRVYEDPASKNLYFHNTKTDATQWVDPRRAEWAKQKKPMTPKDKRILFGVTVVPCVAALIAFSARVIYLQVYYPELLWPTKERKVRKKYRNKEKAPKSRFKVSQDGKGGRSANS